VEHIDFIDYKEVTRLRRLPLGAGQGPAAPDEPGRVPGDQRSLTACAQGGPATSALLPFAEIRKRASGH